MGRVGNLPTFVLHWSQPHYSRANFKDKADDNVVRRGVSQCVFPGMTGTTTARFSGRALFKIPLVIVLLPTWDDMILICVVDVNKKEQEVETKEKRN